MSPDSQRKKVDSLNLVADSVIQTELETQLETHLLKLCSHSVYG